MTLFNPKTMITPLPIPSSPKHDPSNPKTAMQTPTKPLPLHPIILTLIIIFTLIPPLASSSHPNTPYCGKPPLSFLLCNSTKLFSHGDVLFQRLTVTTPNRGRDLEDEVRFRAVSRAPEICRECDMDGGNCSAPVMCLCHAKKCKERILNRSHRSTSSAATSIVLAMATWIIRTVMLV